MTADLANSTPSFISPPVTLPDIPLEKTLSLGVLASGSGSNFEAIAQAIEEGTLNAQVKVLIYNNPNAKVIDRAKKFNTPLILHNHRDYKKRKEFDQVIVQTLKDHGVEWVIMAGWMRIITPVLLNAFPDHVLNIHPSLLPSFPGLHGVEQALASGVKVTGCTVHIAHEKVDSGPILMQAAVPILPDDTADSLHARIQIQEHKIFPRAIALAAKRLGG